MQRAGREPAAWKPCVHCGDTEGQHRCGAPVPAFDLPDLDAQGLKGGLGPHGVKYPPRAKRWITFPICSGDRPQESRWLLSEIGSSMFTEQ